MLLIVNVLQKSIFITIPFLAIYATEQLKVKDSFLGTLTTFQMLGGICGNLVAMWLAPKYGSKSIIVLGIWSLIISFALVFCPISKTMFLLIFFALGSGMFLSIVGFDSVLLDVVSEKKRPTCTAFYATITFPFILIAAGISAILMNYDNGIMIANAITLSILFISLIFLLKIPKGHTINSNT